MELNVLAVGDVVSQAGLDFLERRLPRLKRELGVHFTVVNGENAAGIGLLPRQARRPFWTAGADVVTLGNHTWSKHADRRLSGRRPLRSAPGQLFRAAARPGLRRVRRSPRSAHRRDEPHWPSGAEPQCWTIPSPPPTGCWLRAGCRHRAAWTSTPRPPAKSGPLGWYLDGRVSAVWGTHTHVPTADGKILPKGTGHVTDLGMTGPANSILGIRPEQSINIFLGGLPQRYEAAPGKCKLESVLFTIDTNTKQCIRTRAGGRSQE